MARGHAHDHRHERAHAPAERRDEASRRDERRRLGLTLGLVCVYLLAEVVGGWLSGSLALLADAGHMASDAAALGLSLFALWIASRPSDARRTYGHLRAEILAALANGAALLGVSVLIVIEAIERLAAPPAVRGGLMLAVAAGGLVVNLAGLLLLHAGSRHSLNVRGAFLHVMGDTLGSVGAIAAGAVVWAFGWYWADPVASLAIATLVVWAAWQLLREAVDVLMEAAPRHLDVEEIRTALLELPDVCGLHDLHVWTITSGTVSLSCHVVTRRSGPADTGEVLGAVQRCLAERFGIEHATIQVEGATGATPDVGAPDADACADAACDTPSPARARSAV